MKKIVFVVSLTLLTACGNNSLSSPKKKLDPVPAPPEGNRSCPTGTFQNFHTVALTFTKGLPHKIAIKLDGDADPRINECKQPMQTGVIASMSRDSATTLTLKVVHNGFYLSNGEATLPRNQGLEIIDMHGCDGTMGTSFYKTATPLTLDWRISYPNTTLCPSFGKGEASSTVNDVEALQDWAR